MKALGSYFSHIFSLMLIIGCSVVPVAAQSPLWGLTSGGGQGAGTIVRMDDNGANFSAVALPVIKGKSPSEDLLKATNGKFYGMTTAGGDNDGGVIFEYDIATNSYLVLHHFEVGSIPKGSLIETGGKFYGTTSGGGSFTFGVIFEYNLATSVFTVLYDFGTSVGDGTSPEGSLVLLGGKFYGMTYGGGSFGFGTIFEYDPGSDTHTVIHSFDDTNNGSNPLGSLIVSGQTLCGVTSSGGTFYSGVLFEFNLLAASINVLYNFDDDIPSGSLIAYSGKFYGMTLAGGTNFEGSIFEYAPSTDIYSELFSFDNDVYGSYPFGSLVESGGKLYGMTNGGGSNFSGVLFEYTLSNSNYNILHQFDPVIIGGGASPFGSPIVSDGKLYGLTSSGGTAGFGTMFEYSIGGGPFNVKVIFENASIGSSPQGDLISSGMNWYGMAMSGGNNNKGTIFKYDPTGQGTLSALHHFSGTDGEIPTGSLILFNGNLYGMTSQGGTNSGGVILEYNVATETYNVKHNFAIGSTPKGSLLEWNGMFYGLTSNGGTGSGEIFQFDPMTNTYTSLHAFNGAFGAFPFGNLIQFNGLLYGMTTTSNTQPGVLFQLDPTDQGYGVLHYFTGGNNDGAAPYGSLVIHNGSLYGMTRDGGDVNLNQGIIFKYDPAGSGTYSVLLKLNNTNGSNPEGSLTVIGNNFYGMTKQGGMFGGGVVFKCDINGMNYVVLKHFDDISGQSPFGSLSPAGCRNPSIASVSADINPISCSGNTSNLTVTGLLNDATDWKWYTSSCGGTLVGMGTTISVMPQATTTYFVRGEGGCTLESVCSSITINIATPIVINTNDSGAGSLRAAIACASDGGTIAFDPLVLGISDTIKITSASLDINKSISINQTLSTIVKIKSTGPHPIFNVQAGKTLALTYANLFISPNPNILGRAILNNGNLQISNVNIQERSQNLSGSGSTMLNNSGSNVNISSSNQIIIQN